MYAKDQSSYMYLPREIRSALLCKNEYLDFDIVNAHPTLLLEYVLNYMSNYTPKTLSMYVSQRDKLLEHKSIKDTCTLDKAK